MLCYIEIKFSLICFRPRTPLITVVTVTVKWLLLCLNKNNSVLSQCAYRQCRMRITVGDLMLYKYLTTDNNGIALYWPSTISSNTNLYVFGATSNVTINMHCNPLLGVMIDNMTLMFMLQTHEKVYKITEIQNMKIASTFIPNIPLLIWSIHNTIDWINYNFWCMTSLILSFYFVWYMNIWLFTFVSISL